MKAIESWTNKKKTDASQNESFDEKEANKAIIIYAKWEKKCANNDTL